MGRFRRRKRDADALGSDEAHNAVEWPFASPLTVPLPHLEPDLRGLLSTPSFPAWAELLPSGRLPRLDEIEARLPRLDHLEAMLPPDALDRLMKGPDFRGLLDGPDFRGLLDGPDFRGLLAGPDFSGLLDGPDLGPR